MTKWYQLSGNDNDTAVSTKVALARNLSGHAFTINLSSEEKDCIAREVMDVLNEQLLVSPEFVSFAEGRHFISTPDESLSLMVCEEDHLKIQAMLPGLELSRAYELADRLDSLLDEHLLFSFDKKLGYLTQCPANIGTAMRASVMLQLPALRIRGRIQTLASNISRLGLHLTGAYGEGENPVGSLYSLSNPVTLGISEDAALSNLKSLSESIIDQEREARPALKTKIENLAQYDTILLGYPNWWASIPMPIATLLESYDFSGKTIAPFCSHGGGRLGQSLTAIAKLAPKSKLTPGLSVHYGGGSSLDRDIDKWLAKNGLKP